MPKVRRQRNITDAHIYYRRQGSPTIYARDHYGRYNCFRVAANMVARLPSGISTLPPNYARVDFTNGVRFTGRVRSQTTLRQAYDAWAGMKLSTGWYDLPASLSGTRRTSNQGMNGATTVLCCARCSATRYAIWYDGRNPGEVDSTVQWEWCHLRAHSQGGADDETNIVAAVKGNNSEQLAIENALSMYRPENEFQLKVSAVTLDTVDGEHLGNVIRYKVRSRTVPGGDFELYLDCLQAPQPSEIHYYDVLRNVAHWANRKLLRISDHFNPVSGTERRMVRDYML